ncbi:MAG: hypothetical protein NTZ73_02030 [Candidatus Diapherotrites archaeon]|nr:hypothetical protein [Candidatus Diapherotrites archaeon]
MSTKGESKSCKARSAPKAVHIPRKEMVWTVRAKAGPHKREMAVPLGIILRDSIKIGRTMKEAKKIANAGLVKVNGMARRDCQFAVGIFDTVVIEAQKLFYRIIIDKQGRLVIKEMKKPSNEKLCRVEGKKNTKEGIVIRTNDGRTLKGVKASVGDTIKILVPENKVEKIFELKEGALAYLINGTHAGETAKIRKIVSGTVTRKKLVKLEANGKEFETTIEKVFVIGDKEAGLEELGRI